MSFCDVSIFDILGRRVSSTQQEVVLQSSSSHAASQSHRELPSQITSLSAMIGTLSLENLSAGPELSSSVDPDEIAGNSGTDLNAQPNTYQTRGSTSATNQFFIHHNVAANIIYGEQSGNSRNTSTSVTDAHQILTCS